MKIQMFNVRVLLLFTLLIISVCRLTAQKRENLNGGIIPSTPRVGIKTNLLYDATATLNLGVEFKLANRLTLDVSGNYNPWTFSENKKLKHLLIQPELRYWLCEPFYGHFFGTHLLYAHYNVAKIELPFDLYPSLKDYRYQGDAYGAGISYGYQWMLAHRWSLEATAGVGYLYTDFKKYEGEECGNCLGSGNKHYFGPTKLGLSLIFNIK